MGGNEALAVTRRERPAAPRERARVQSACLERAQAEARYEQARRARARRRWVREALPAEPAPDAPVAFAMAPRVAFAPRMTCSAPSRGSCSTAPRVTSAVPVAFAMAPRGRGWRVAFGAVALIGLVLATAELARVPVTLHATGALHAVDGLRSIEPALAGVLREVLVQPGDEVAPGQIVARLDDAPLLALLATRERELSALRQSNLSAARAEAGALTDLSTAIDRQRAALGQRRDMALTQHEQDTLRLQSYREAVLEGLISAGAEQPVRDAVLTGDANLALIDVHLAELGVSLAERRHETHRRELERSRALERALGDVEAARAQHTLAEVRSAIAGRVDSVLVAPGARVEPGVVLARVVPTGTAWAMVVMLPWNHARWVEPGMEADVDLTTVGGPERARARVTHLPNGGVGVPGSLSPGRDAVVPVELSLLGDAALSAALPRADQRVSVQLHTGRQRGLFSVLGALRVWRQA